MEDNKRPTHLRMVRPGRDGQIDEAQMRESHRPAHLMVKDRNGKVIFERRGLSSFGALPHLDQELYGEFFVADQWLKKSQYKRLFVRPGAEAIVVCGPDAEDQGFALTFEYPDQTVPIDSPAIVFSILNPEGKEIFKLEGIDDWHFIIEIDPRGHPRAIALDQRIGNIVRRTNVLIGVANTVVVEALITYPE